MDWIEYLSTLGPVLPYLVIICFLALTGAGLPVPEEVPIVAAGVLASGAHPDLKLNVTIALICCIIGALLGDTLVYAAGRLLGRSFFRRHKWYAMMMHEDREKQMEDLIDRHGLKVFFVARFMIGIRAPVYMAAGVMRVPLARFLLVDGIAATVVVGLVFGLSYRYGEQIRWLVHEFSIVVTIIGIVAILTALVIYFWRRGRRQPPSINGQAGSDPPTGDQRPNGSLPSDDTRAARMSA
ncbi:MAG: DedA family protein [Planctomycetes bacterium]|nr:DedA family protein [Planctomycetota bacterium]